MTKTFLIALVSLICLPILGQSVFLSGNYMMKFDDTTHHKQVSIGNAAHPNKLWEIGKPQKTNFTSAYSPPNAIVTDTVNPYPVMDTSVFTITNLGCEGFIYDYDAHLSGNYSVNSDSLTDYGMIEFSPNNGRKWVNLTNDTAYHFYYSWNGGGKPVLTGNSGGWKPFWVSVQKFGSVFNMHCGDTVLWRFTFISDGVQTNKDGLMFDNLSFVDIVEGIKEYSDDRSISISPNPATDRLRITASAPARHPSVSILNELGQLILNIPEFTGNEVNIETLPPGIYLLQYKDGSIYSEQKFIRAR